MGREFKLKISPRMLSLLSKDLYSNIYFVLAELIANSYDADAENVYIFIDDNEIRVEDDGNGMSEEDLDAHYLLVGSESRSCEENSRTRNKKRLKMGRKGVGKLAALSISEGFKLITKQDNCKPIGIFVPNKIDHEDQILKNLSPLDYELKTIKTHGTAIIMEKPKIKIPKLQDTIIQNISKIFPNSISDFKIHVVFKGKEKEVIPTEVDAVKRLVTFISIGKEKEDLTNFLPKSEPNLQIEKINEIVENIEMDNSAGKSDNVELKIYGWIGTYKTTKGMKKEINEFSENYLAIFAHNKMGLRNVLPVVSRNKVYESYIVGNLYIDAFEAPDFPDMAGTNRQGYNENDPRWNAAVKHIRDIVDKAVKQHEDYAKLDKFEKEHRKNQMKEENEKELKAKLEKASSTISKNLSSKISNKSTAFEINQAVSDELNKMKSVLGFKATVDADKKKIIISQCLKDKNVADLIYKMLLFNNVPKQDIIYSNGPDPETNLPEKGIYDYLRNFFVNSASSEMIYVLFVTSENVLGDSSHSWGVLMEIGATWITQKDHWIFNIGGFIPEAPLNTENKWVSIYIDDNDGDKTINMVESAVNSFVQKIIETCQSCGYIPKSFNDNKEHIKNYIVIKEYI